MPFSRLGSGILRRPNLLEIISICWPHIRLYNKQVEFVKSLETSRTTVAPSANEVGKDFILGLSVLAFFLTRSPCRIVTTSVDQSQLEKVLWGEINNFIATSVINLHLAVNYCDIKQLDTSGDLIPKSYLIGRVAGNHVGLLGHHLPKGPNNAPRTMMAYDEASGVDSGLYKKTMTWAHRTALIGNCFPCNNEFKELSEAGDQVAEDDPHLSHYVRVLRIKATDSPNVRRALHEIKAGQKPSHKEIIPGVLTYSEYLERQRFFDDQHRCVSLEAQWYKGKELYLFPDEWLDHAENQYLEEAESLGKRQALVLACDSAAGGDNTCWTWGDAHGPMDQLSMKTKDTNVVFAKSIELIEDLQIEPENVYFDVGGGGQQHVDRLRQTTRRSKMNRKYDCQLLAFGAATTDSQKVFLPSDHRKALKYRYKNLRAEMYGRASEWMNLEADHVKTLLIPPKLKELRRQLSKMPLKYDAEGKRYLPPKNPKEGNSKEPSLSQLIGCSPDEADSFVMFVHGIEKLKSNRPLFVVGV